jgi:hypothetical protein
MVSFFFLCSFKLIVFFCLFMPIFYIGTTTTTTRHHPAQANTSKMAMTEQEQWNGTNRTHGTATNRTMAAAMTVMAGGLAGRRQR